MKPDSRNTGNHPVGPDVPLRETGLRGEPMILLLGTAIALTKALWLLFFLFLSLWTI
ncbi:hypothetical protein HMPREF9374_2454 [Desmospora sp. 8437]|nr:hypothetical protein HMPREF9374_2454 [Desmospora sp. 8437]